MSTIVDISLTVDNSNPITLPISSTPGTYTAVLKVGGRPYVYQVTIGGASSTMENVFQANNLHTLTIYESDGVTILDDTIYNITTDAKASLQIKQYITIPVTTTDGMNEYQNGVLKGAQSVDVIFEGSYMHDTTWTPADDTVGFPYPVDAKQRMIIKVAK